MTLLKQLIVTCGEIGHQRINIVYIKVDSSMPKFHGNNFLSFSPAVSNGSEHLSKQELAAELL